MRFFYEQIANQLRNSEFFRDTGKRIPLNFVTIEVWEIKWNNVKIILKRKNIMFFNDELLKYNNLKNILDGAFEQAKNGKGKERHETNDKPFEEQHMCSIQRLLKNHPTGGLAFQSIKKIVEAGVLYNQNKIEEAKKEILGAIIYTAGMIILLDEEE